MPEEAKIIRLIAQNHLNGDSLRTIKETLESMGVPTATGNQNWSTEAIQCILQNEKYMGDVLLQKTYTADFIEGKVKKNNGELPQYYIKDNHLAIIPRKSFIKSRMKSPAGKYKARQCQESQNQSWPVYQQIRSFGKTCLRELRLLLSKGDMEHPRTEANRLAMHQPAGMWAKGLQGFLQPQGR